MVQSQPTTSLKTCCALHNWLLEINGLDDEWDRGVPSEWEGSLGQHHLSDPQTADFFALHRLEATDVHYDLCSTGYGRGGGDNSKNFNESSPESTSHETIAEQTRKVRRVWKLSLPFFRGKLIDHFDILWHQHKIEWPVRNRVEKTADWQT
jgi:hypothetical protein